MKKRKLTEEHVAVRQDQTTGYWLPSAVVTCSFYSVIVKQHLL